MKPELELQLYKSVTINLGIAPASWNGVPRSEYDNGRNDAIMEHLKKAQTIIEFFAEKNLTEGQQLKIAELLKEGWIDVYAFREDLGIYLYVNWDDFEEIKNLTMEDMDSMYEYFLQDKSSQYKWVEEYWHKKDQIKNKTYIY